MPELPRISGAEALKALQKPGFEKVRNNESGKAAVTL
jgi:predicted RNA binding protein YcfA (HicA-like mRNA interferase family)